MSRTSTTGLLNIYVGLFALVSIGCHSEVPALDPKYSAPPPNDAPALSGGKITHFIPSPTTNPADPDDRTMLKACRQLNGIGSVARSGIAVLTFRSNASNRVEKTGVAALVISKGVLVEPSGVERFMGRADSIGRKGYVYHRKGRNVTMTAEGSYIIYPNWPGDEEQFILLNPGSKFANVGGTQVALQQPVIWVDGEKDQVMLLSDLVKLFKVSDAQTGAQSIIKTSIVYKLPPMGRF